MNNTVQSTPVSTSNTKTTLCRFGRMGSLVVSSLFVLSIVLQVFLAGGGIFAASTWWPIHIIFGMTIILFPVAFLALAWMGQLGRHSLWLSGLAIVLVAIQSVLVTLPATLGVPGLSALHPVNALVIFGLALWLAQEA